MKEKNSEFEEKTTSIVKIEGMSLEEERLAEQEPDRQPPRLAVDHPAGALQLRRSDHGRDPGRGGKMAQEALERPAVRLREEPFLQDL